MKKRSILTALGALIAAVIIFIVGWWAARATLTTTTEPTPTAEVLTAEAREGRVGRTFNFSVTIQTPFLPVAVNQLSGVVTKVGPAEAADGSVLVVVGDQGIIAVESALPFYRDLGPGVRGEDVRALQSTLIHTGYLAGEADGVFGSLTARALSAFQKDNGLAQTGDAPLGTLYAFPSLPATVTYGEDLRPSAVVAGGETLISAPSGERTFTITVSESQQEFVPAGATVTFTVGGEEFVATIAEERTMTEQGDVTVHLLGPDGASVCDTRCDLLPNRPKTTVLAQVQPEAPVTGVTVPVAAVRTTPDGQAFVTLADATTQEVTVRGSGQGLAVVDGIDVGTIVQISQAGTSTPAAGAPEPSPDTGSEPAPEPAPSEG